MADGGGDTGTAATALVVVTTNAADSAACTRVLAAQLAVGSVHVCTGYYPAVAALGCGATVVVVDIGPDDEREVWRLAELRGRSAGAAFLVVADATRLPALRGAVRADLAVTSADRLPPLRELLVSDDAMTTDTQTSSRRSRR